jgi:lipopolysaccharide/colanic/teichoic acid biosynthesis glycosyltransferase
VRRAVDVVMSTLLLLVISPVMLIAAIGICCADFGPIFFCSKRVGEGGKLFTMHKFRTMRLESGSRITAENDPRIFTWGRILRSTKIDELPQLLDILLGHMSIIGPRPEDPIISKKVVDPRWKDVLSFRPGLVSPGSLLVYRAQQVVDYKDSELHYIKKILPKKIEIDLVFFQNRTLLKDCKILFEAAVLIIRRGK